MAPRETTMPVMNGTDSARRGIAAATLIVVCTLAGAGCRVKEPPARAKVQKDAMRDIALTEPWKARTPIAGAVPDDWLASFADPKLTALVNEAVANNPDLRVSEARVEQSAEYVKLAKAKLSPAVGFAGRGSTKLGADLGTGLSGGILGASWELDLWGRIRYARNATAEDYASALADQEYARQSIAAATANAWFLATETLRQRVLAEQLVEYSKQLVAIAEKREEVGVGEEQDVALARANLSSYQDALVQVRDAYTESLRAVEQLLGRYPSAELDARVDLPKLPGPVPAGIPLEMLERRPDMFAAERRVAAAFNRVGEARAARLPQLSLTGTTGYITSETIALKPSFSNPGRSNCRLVACADHAGALKTQVKIRTLQQKEGGRAVCEARAPRDRRRRERARRRADAGRARRDSAACRRAARESARARAGVVPRRQDRSSASASAAARGLRCSCRSLSSPERAADGARQPEPGARREIRAVRIESPPTSSQKIGMPSQCYRHADFI